jgi:hypothetical protein
MNMKRCSVLVLPIVALASSVRAMPMDHGAMMGHSKMSMSDTKSENARMLIQTLSEEKTEINSLTAQQAAFRKLGDAQSMKIARLWGVWIREHKAAGPKLMQLIKANGGDPSEAKILKAPPLGDKMKMLHATHVDHAAAVATSQMRHRMTKSGAIKMAMHKRAALARKHMRQMAKYHNEKNCPMCAAMMKNGNMGGMMHNGAMHGGMMHDKM